MLHTPGLIGSFAAGMNIPEQFFASRAQLKKAHENLLHSKILDKYLPQHQRDLIQHAADAHLIEHQNLLKLQALAPYLSAQSAANLQKTRIGASLAAPLARIQAIRASTQAGQLEQSKTRFNRPAYLAKQITQAAPGVGQALVNQPGGALAPTIALHNYLHQAALQSAPAPQSVAPPINIPTQMLPLHLLGPQGQTQSTLPAAPFAGGPPGAPQQMSPQGAVNAPTQAQMPSPMPTVQPRPVSAGTPQMPPGQTSLPSAPGAPLSPPEPVNMQESALKALEMGQIKENKKAVSPQLWNRALSAGVLEDQFNNPGFRALAKNATKFAGTSGAGKAFAQSLLTTGTPEYNQYQQFLNITVPNMTNQVRQMEGLSVQPSQRKELEGMLTSWNHGLSRLTSNPVRALQFMNEAGREFNVIARSLQKQAHPIYPAQHPIQPWDPIGSKQPTLTFKTKDEFQNWMKTASQSQIRAEIAKLKG